MSSSDAFSKNQNFAISRETVSDLERVVETLEALEIRMCVLSVQMQYDRSTHAPRAAELSREVGEISERLENILTFQL